MRPTPSVVARRYQNLRSGVVTKVTNFLERRFDAQAASFYARLIAAPSHDPMLDTYFRNIALLTVRVPQSVHLSTVTVDSERARWLEQTSFEQIHKRR